MVHRQPGLVGATSVKDDGPLEELVAVSLILPNSVLALVCTGSLSRTVLGVETSVPLAQLGVQVLCVYTPVAVATVVVHDDQRRWST